MFTEAVEMWKMMILKPCKETRRFLNLLVIIFCLIYSLTKTLSGTVNLASIQLLIFIFQFRRAPPPKNRSRARRSGRRPRHRPAGNQVWYHLFTKKELKHGTVMVPSGTTHGTLPASKRVNHARNYNNQ